MDADVQPGAAIAVGGLGLCVGGTYLTLKTHA